MREFDAAGGPWGYCLRANATQPGIDVHLEANTFSNQRTPTLAGTILDQAICVRADGRRRDISSNATTGSTRAPTTVRPSRTTRAIRRLRSSITTICSAGPFRLPRRRRHDRVGERDHILKTYPRSREDWRSLPIVLSEDELLVGGWQVMQRWETPLMEALADEVTAAHGDVLEIGFGMGIAATAIVERGCRTYTVIEAHPAIAELARDWASSQPVATEVVEGFWQEVVPAIGEAYDGILFDTFPMSRRERRRNHFDFIPHAPRLLRAGGVLTHYSDETLDFRPGHLRLLLEHFDEVKLVKVTGLRPTAVCEYWHDSTMVVPVARKSG